MFYAMSVLYPRSFRIFFYFTRIDKNIRFNMYAKKLETLISKVKKQKITIN
jgi:hypothetical protein